MRIFLRKFWGWLVGTPLAIYGVFTLVRDEFLPVQLQARLRIGGILGAALALIPWQYWLIAGLLVLLVSTNRATLAGILKRIRSKTHLRGQPPASPAITLARGYRMTPLESAQEYSFTVVNESDSDLSECYVSLESSTRRLRKSDEWELEQEKLVDAPFRWLKPGASADGRIAIEQGDRAAFALGRSTSYQAMNSQTKQMVPLFEFTLSLHSADGNPPSYELYIGYEYRLVIAIRAKDEDGTRLPKVAYELHVRPTATAGPAGGLDVLGVRRLQ